MSFRANIPKIKFKYIFAWESFESGKTLKSYENNRLPRPRRTSWSRNDNTRIMLSHSYKLRGFVLNRRNYGEADRMITVYSQDHGKKTLMAKGLRRITSRRAGALELFNHVTMLVIEGRGMDIITEVQLERNYQSLSQNYYKTVIAYQLIELVDSLTRDAEVHEGLFELMDKAFEYIYSSDIDKRKVDEILLRFKIDF